MRQERPVGLSLCLASNAVPLYEYQCKANGHRFEVRHGVNDAPVTVCQECGEEVRRVIQPVGIVFKGSGFYATDSRSSSTASKPAETSSKEDKDSGKSKESSKSDASSESKSDTSKSDSGNKPAAAG
jgi:putative FmdB family regulatory protein